MFEEASWPAIAACHPLSAVPRPALSGYPELLPAVGELKYGPQARSAG
jgi:hypothetical protein